MTIRSRILLVMLALVAFTSLGMMLVGHVSYRKAVYQYAETLLEERMAASVNHLEGRLGSMMGAVQRVSRSEDLASWLRDDTDPDAAMQSLEWTLGHARMDGLLVLDPQGVVLLQAGDADFLQQLALQPTTAGLLERGLGSWWTVSEGELAQVALAPISVDGRRLALLLGAMRFGEDQQALLREVSGADLAFYLEDQVLLHTLADEEVTSISFTPLTAYSGGGDKTRRVRLLDKRYLARETSLNTGGTGAPVQVSLLIPIEKVSIVGTLVRWRLAVIGLAAAILCVLLSLLLARSISQPLEGLVAFARRAADGDYSPIKQQTPMPEFAVLEDALSDMLRQRERAQERVTRRARNERDLEIDHWIQDSVATEPQDVPGFDTALGSWRGAAAGGDYADVIEGDDGSLWIALGEAGTRGLRAGMIVTLLHGAVRTAVLANHEVSPAALLLPLDRMIADYLERVGWKHHFAALRLVRISPDGLASFAGAQEEMLLFSNGDEGRVLNWEGPWLGLRAAATAGDQTVQLQHGDTLVLMSDGLLSAQDGSGRPFGSERVMQMARDAAGHPARVVRDRLMATWEKWATDPGDDATLIVLRRRGGS